MPDIWSKEKRSAVMSLIKSHGNKDTELRLIIIFRAAGITGWRRKHKLVGKPDFVFRKVRLVVFVDGCFWHRCPRHKVIPKSNEEFWVAKLERNYRRDRLVTRTLRQQGWHVLRIWEHALKHPEKVAVVIRRALKIAEGKKALFFKKKTLRQRTRL